MSAKRIGLACVCWALLSAGCIEPEPFQEGQDAAIADLPTDSDPSDTDVGNTDVGDTKVSDTDVGDVTSPCAEDCLDADGYCDQGECLVWPARAPEDALVDCQAILEAYTSLEEQGHSGQVKLVSGDDWFIDPDGAGGSPPFSNYCEFDTLGGGWTRIWYQDEPNETELGGWFGDESKSQHATELLKRDMLEVMAAYQDKSEGDQVVTGSMVRFGLPAGWAQFGGGNGLSQSTWTTVVFETPESQKREHVILHFGMGIPSAGCGQPTGPEEGQQGVGLFCIENTGAPFYTGFASEDPDQCGVSSVGLTAEDTCQKNRFALFVRVGCGDPDDPMCQDADLDGKKPIEGDCHDGEYLTYPGSNESCDLDKNGSPLDEDCDSVIDEPNAKSCNEYYLDADLDSFTTDESAQTACLCGPDSTSGYQISVDSVNAFGDCDDDDPTVNPGANEACDDVDNNCDGTTDEGFIGVIGDACDGGDNDECPNGTWTCTDAKDAVECVNETEEDIAEVCDMGVTDENCDGVTDEANAEGCDDYYLDGDGDGDGDEVEVQVQCLCAPDEESGYTAAEAEDCDDDNPNISSKAQESCSDDGADSDCDGESDAEEAIDCFYYLPDVDGDGHGDKFGNPICLCAPDPEQSLTGEFGGDCDDENAAIKPGADELCDGVDNDCDGKTDSEDELVISSEEPGALCQKSAGVCAGALKPAGYCVDGSWSNSVCSINVYNATAASGDAPYEADEELSCDLADNDCDDKVDEDFQTNGVYDSVEHCGACGASCHGIPGATEVECQVNGDSASCEVLACDTGFILEDGGVCTPWPLLTVDCTATTDEAAGLYKYIDAVNDSGVPNALEKAAELGGAVIEVKACLGQPYGRVVIDSPIVLRGKPGGARPKIYVGTWSPSGHASALKVAASDVIVEYLELSGGSPVVDVLKESSSLENIVLNDLVIHDPVSYEFYMPTNTFPSAPNIGLRVTAVANIAVENVEVMSVAAQGYQKHYWDHGWEVEPDWHPMSFGILIEAAYAMSISNVSVTDVTVNGDGADDVEDPETVDQENDDNRGWAAGIRIVGSQEVTLESVYISDVAGLEGQSTADSGMQAGDGGQATGLEVIDSNAVIVRDVAISGIQSGEGGADTSSCGGQGEVSDSHAGDARGLWVHGTGSSSVHLDNVIVSNVTGGDSPHSANDFNGGLAYGLEFGEKATVDAVHLLITEIEGGTGGGECPDPPSAHGNAAGIHIRSDEGGLVDHATIVQVSSPGESASIAFGQTDNNIGANQVTAVRNSILANGGTWGLSAVMGGWGEISYSLITGADVLVNESVDMGGGMLMGEPPRFVKSGSGNFHLQPISPAIDTGDPESEFNNEPEPNGGRVNMGYYGNTDEAGLAPGASKTDPEAPCADSVLWFEGSSGGGPCGCMSLLEGDPAPSNDCGVGLCAGGFVECADGGTVCSTSDLAQDETCNDIDDDCDGPVDEGFGDLAEICNGEDDN